MTKPGPIIGLILGIGMAIFPIIGFLIGEGSLSDSKGKMIGFGFIIFGAFMVMVNIIALAKGTDNVLASSNDTTSHTTKEKHSSKQDEEDEEDEPENKVKCRFCKKSYDAEYNGCPYCKKK